MIQIKQITGYKIYMNQMLGEGSFGAVYKGINDETGQKVAIKILNKQKLNANQYMKKALFSQIMIMKHIKCENIVQLYDAVESINNYYIIQQLCDGDLQSILKNGIAMQQRKAKQYLLQIAKGFATLVRQGVIHRDLKPANIMIKNNILKIGDLGLSKKCQIAQQADRHTIIGTPLYMSIQILKAQEYSSKCDIWALGYIFYQMLHGKLPWIGQSQFQLLNAIQNKPLQINQKLSQYTINFLQRCLSLTEQNRISWDQLFVHPIFNNYFIYKQCKQQSQFENKFKMIMTKLRFQIHSQNINIQQILQNKFNIKNNESVLNKQIFYRFLKTIQPNISKQDTNYIMKVMSKTEQVPIKSIYQMMKNNKIYINTNINNKQSNDIQKYNYTYSSNINTKNDNKQIKSKLKRCFQNILTFMNINNRTLKDIFGTCNQHERKSLNQREFRDVINIVRNDLTNNQIEGAFDSFNKNTYNQVEYSQLDRYFNKLNGRHIQLVNQ